MNLKLSLKENVSSILNIQNKIEAKQIFPTKAIVELALQINPRMQVCYKLKGRPLSQSPLAKPNLKMNLP